MIIGLSGRAGSGKDTVGRMLVKHGFETIALADPMKEFCAEVFDWPRDRLWGPSKLRDEVDEKHDAAASWERYCIAAPRLLRILRVEEYQHIARGLLDQWFFALPVDGLTPRRALQTLGTEFGRAFDKDLWVRYAIRRARELLSCTANIGVAITDVRFLNERDAIYAAGGKVWRIVRPGAGLIGDAAQHTSETELTDDMTYDRVVDNGDRSLDELGALVDRIITGRT